MDITSINATSRAIEITHPASGEPIGLRITVLPESDPKVKKAQRANLNKQLSSRKNKMTAEQIESNSFAVLLAAVGDWEWYGDATFGGEKPEFNADNVRKVLTTLPWVKDQVRDEFDNAESFFEG